MGLRALVQSVFSAGVEAHLAPHAQKVEAFASGVRADDLRPGPPVGCDHMICHEADKFLRGFPDLRCQW